MELNHFRERFMAGGTSSDQMWITVLGLGRRGGWWAVGMASYSECTGCARLGRNLVTA